MSVEEILDMLDEMIDRAWNLPMTGGRCVLDADKVRDLLDEIRENLPNEIMHAKKIVAERAQITGEAKREAEAIVRHAEERAKALIAQEEVVRQAQQQAREITSQTQLKSREMRQAAQDFSDTALRNAEEGLAKALAEVKATRQALRAKGGR